MLFGHIAVGLAAKPVAPKASLGALLVSATAIDTLCGVFVLAGIETVDANGASSLPWSHGLFMAAVWTIAGSVLAFLFSRDRRTSTLIGLGVFSHWVLDYVSHPMGMGRDLPPDLPLFFEGSPKVGLGMLFLFLLALPAAVPQLSLLPTLALVLLLPIGNWVDRHRSVLGDKCT